MAGIDSHIRFRHFVEGIEGDTSLSVERFIGRDVYLIENAHYLVSGEVLANNAGDFLFYWKREPHSNCNTYLHYSCFVLETNIRFLRPIYSGDRDMPVVSFTVHCSYE